MVSKLSNLWNHEPAALLWVLQTAITAAATFGFELDGKQIAGLMTFFGALITFITRRTVTSPATVQKMRAELEAKIQETVDAIEEIPATPVE